MAYRTRMRSRARRRRRSGRDGTEEAVLPPRVAQETIDPSVALQRVLAARPAWTSPADILALQQTVGNRAVQRLLTAAKRDDVAMPHALGLSQTGVVQRSNGKRAKAIKKRYEDLAKKQRQHAAQYRTPGTPTPEQSASAVKARKTKPAAQPQKPPTLPPRTYKRKQRERLREKFAATLLPSKDGLVAVAGAPNWLSSRLYKQLLAQLDRYHATKRNAPYDFDKQLAALGALGTAAEAWMVKFLIFSRTRRRQAIVGLLPMVGAERARLRRLKALKSELLATERQKYLDLPGPELERWDPEHREASVLSVLYYSPSWRDKYQAWQKAHQEKTFYDWVSELERQADTGLVALVYGKISKILIARLGKNDTKNKWMAQVKDNRWIPRIKYLMTAEEQAEYKLKFTGTKVSYERSGAALERNEKYIYAMSADGAFYAIKETLESPLKYHHSSLLGGAPVAAAGAMKVYASSIEIDLESGHYQPTLQHVINAVKALMDQGVSGSALQVYPFFGGAGARPPGVRAKDLVAGIRALQAALRADEGFDKLSEAIESEGRVRAAKLAQVLEEAGQQSNRFVELFATYGDRNQLRELQALSL